MDTLLDLYHLILSSRRIKRLLVLMAFLAIVIFVGFWLYGHAFILISASGGKTGDYSYTLTNQATHQTTTFQDSSPSIKKLVRRGRYEVLVQQGSTSYFSIVEVGGFLKTTELKGNVVVEKSRTFVGNNPAFCMSYTGQLLFSYPCQGTFSQLQAHVPATGTQPTYTQINQAAGRDSNDTIEGIITLPTGTFILLHGASNNPITGNSHVLYQLQNDLSISGGQLLNDLDPGKNYSLQTFQKGFIVYDDAFSRVWSYDTPASTPVVLKIEAPADKHYSATKLSAWGDSLTLLYSYVSSGTAASSKVKTEVITYTSSQMHNYFFSDSYSTAEQCDKQLLCLQDSGKLAVFDISGPQPIELYKLSGVEAEMNTSNGFLVVQPRGVLNFAAGNQQGFLEYSLGSYTFCGMQAAGNGYLVCVANQKGTQSVLYIDQKSNDGDSIDKKVAELVKLPAINSVSPYGKYIYLTPNLGTLAADSNGNNVPNPAVLRQNNSLISQAINQLGIDRKVYTVINPFQ